MEYLNDDITFLTEIFSLESMHYDMVEESIRTNHMYQCIGDPDILLEGFADMVKSMGEFFKKMIEKVKEFFKKMLMYINSYFMDIDKFVKKYKQDLDKLDNVDFDILGYNFTLHDKPNTSCLEKIVSDYNSALAGISKLKKEEVRKEQNEFLETRNLDKLRGEILGTNNPMEEEDFRDNIRKYYRDGESETQSIHVDTAMLKKVISDSDQLMKDKKEAEKTRDNLLILLEKAEKFFNGKISVIYKDAKDQIKLSELSMKDEKLTTGEVTYTPSGDSQYQVVELFIRFKYNQTHEVASMINMVTTERVNAFKDQVKMYREILQKSLFSAKDDDDKKESVTDSAMIVEPYTSIIEESHINNMRLQRESNIKQMVYESSFIQKALETGFIPLTEATKDDITHDVIVLAQKAVSKILELFRQACIDRAEKYKPWIDDVGEGFVEKAKTSKGIELTPMWKGHWKEDVSTITKAMNSAFSNYLEGTFDDYKWGVTLLKDTKNIPDQDTNMSLYLRNKFRFNLLSETNVRTETLSGNDLVKQIGAMTSYIYDYADTLPKNADKISDTFSSNLQKVEKASGGTSNVKQEVQSEVKKEVEKKEVTKESVSPKTYLLVENTTLDKSILSLMINYQSVCEAAPNDNPDKKEETVTNSDGKTENDKGTKNSVSQVKTVDNEDNNQNKTEDTASNNGGKEYFNNISSFFKTVIAEYQRASEERFISYVNALVQVYGASPKFDDNGKYIPMNKSKNNKDTQEESVTKATSK